MKIISSRRVGHIFALVTVSALAGCAVYSPPSTAYYSDDGAVVYASPPPVYVAPPVYAAPRYVGPPVFLNFGFGSWGGRGHYRGGWHGGGHHRGRWR